MFVYLFIISKPGWIYFPSYFNDCKTRLKLLLLFFFIYLHVPYDKESKYNSMEEVIDCEISSRGPQNWH